MNEHRSADRWPALLLRSDEVFVDDGDPAQQRGDQKGQRADEQRQKRHGEKGVAGERVDAEKLIERLDEQRMHEVGAEAPAGERADARVSLFAE